jgi:hypothetical protein
MNRGIQMRRVTESFTQGLIFTIVLALLSGCASTGTQTSTAVRERSGFLSNYNMLKPIEGSDGAQAWRLPDVDWKKFHTVLIERIQVFIKENSESKGIDPIDLKMMTDYFYESLVKAFEPAVPIVDKADPGVIGLRIAIVDLVPTKYGRSIVGTLTPYGFVAEAASGPASGRPAGSTPYLGETGIEVQFIDGGTGQVIAEFADHKFGKKYDLDTSKSATGAAKQWVTGYVDSFTTWSYAKQAFDQWANLFRQRFDELRGV